MNRKLKALLQGVGVGLAVGVAGILLVKAARAQETVMVLPPPWRFDHPYRGPITEYRMFVNTARQLCKRKGVEADSCSWLDKGRCYIVVPWDAPVKDLSQYQRHEIAHCNGWGANHEK